MILKVLMIGGHSTFMLMSSKTLPAVHSRPFCPKPAKYGLNLTVANQYISQMTDTVRNAVFGNVGTTISFRASADDAPILSKQFEPQFEAADLLQMHNRNFIINMVINGEKQPAFSASTLNLPPVQTNLLPNIIAHTRSTYSRQRDEVQAEISQRMTPGQTTSTSPVASPQNTPPQPPPLQRLLLRL